VRLELLEILACPNCAGDLALRGEVRLQDAGVNSGALWCGRCDISFPIKDGIPRFVDIGEPDTSFGFQWNLFRKEQLDSWNGAGLSAGRFWSETGWSRESLTGKLVLDVGCGAGRFLEVVSIANCTVVGVDVSTAIDASAKTVESKNNVQLIQADVYRLPFKPGVFDSCYCIGVAQHTPRPLEALRCLPRLLRPGGRLAVTVYEKRQFTKLNGKYLVRPLTRRLNKRVLLAGIRALMPVLFPVTELLFRLPVLGPVFDFIIPVANYVERTELSWRQRYRIAVLDTFDRLAPDFDDPLVEEEVLNAFAELGMQQVRRQANPGLNVVGVAGDRRAR